jgi:hypothetical protein
MRKAMKAPKRHGRQPLGKKKVMYKLYPETIEAVKKRAQQLGISRSEYVEAAVREKLNAS